MSPQQARELLNQRPFVPLRVIMSSGEVYEIRHPEMAWVTKTTLFVGQYSDSGTHGMPDYAAVCAILHISSIEPFAAVAT